MPTLFLGFTEFAVTVESDGNPVGGARVCITDEDLSLYAVGFTDANGEVTIDFGGPVQNPGTATIVVSAHNYIPYITDIPIIPQQGSYLLLNDVDVDDQTGNNNGWADFMEFVSLDVTLENIGIEMRRDCFTHGCRVTGTRIIDNQHVCRRRIRRATGHQTAHQQQHKGNSKVLHLSISLNIITRRQEYADTHRMPDTPYA